MAKTQVSTLELTCNTKRVKQELKEYERLAEDTMKKLADLTDIINAKRSKGIEITKEETALLKKYQDDIKLYTSAQQKGIDEMQRAAEVMKNLAGASIKDINKAIRDFTKEMNSIRDPKGIRVLQGQIDKLKAALTDKKGLTMSVREAKQQIADLANVRTDKLQQGLAALRHEWEALSETDRTSRAGKILQGNIRQYEAQLAVNQVGAVSTKAVSGLSTEALQAERSRLQTAIGAVAQSPTFAKYEAEYKARLEEVNAELKRKGELLKDAAEAQQKQQAGMESSKTLANLEKASYEDLENTLKYLEDRQKKYQGTETKRIAQNLADQDRVKKKMKERTMQLLSEEEIQRRVGQSGKYNINQLQQAYDQLERELKETNTEEKQTINQKRKMMKSLKKDINDAKGEVTGLTKVWKTAVRNIATYVGVFAGFKAVQSKIMDVFRSNLKLSDSMAQVQKVTGMTRKEVDQLNVSFSKLDTRTTLTQLNDLAYSAGKMGIGQYGVEGVRQFVEATNQLQVALGEDLGSSVEEAITPLAKFAENLGLLKKMGVEQAMLSIGSSINELSQTTTATGRNIVDFATRVQPMAKMLKLSASDILALGSATDAFGIHAEKAATAFIRFLTNYRTNTAAIEESLGIAKGSLDELFDQGRTMEGLMMIFQRMHDIGDLRNLENVFKAMGSEGSKMFETFGNFATNVDQLKQHLTTSTVAFAEATSVTNEYNLVQDTAAGILERANNIWEKAFVNPEGVDMVKELAVEWKKLSEDLTGSASWMWGAKMSLEAIATTIGTIVKLAPILIRAMMFYGVVESIRRIYVQMTMLNASMATATTTAGKLSAILKSNVWVLAITAIVFAATALIDMAAASKKAEKALDAVGEAEKNATEESVKQRAELKKLYDATKDNTKSIDERKEALRKMVGDEKYKQYKSDLSDEQVLAREAAKAYSELTDEIIKSAKARAYQQKITELTEKNIALEDANDEANNYLKTNKGKYEAGKKEYKDQQTYVGRVTGGATAGFPESGIAQRGAAAMQPAIIGEYEQKQQDVISNQEAIKKNDADILKLEQKIKALNVTDEAGPGGGGGGGGGESPGGGSNTSELNAEFRDEQAKVKDIINKVKNFYQRQINAINDMATVGTIDEQQQKEMVEGMQSRMNTALAEVRKAIGGTKNDWDKFKQTMIDDLYEPLNEEGTNWSVDIVNDILDNDLVQLRAMIEKLSKALNKNGQQLLEQILRKASEDEAKNIDLANKQMRARQDELRRKNYTEQTDYNYIGVMDQFQIGDTTETQNAQIQAWSQAGDKKAIEGFFAERTKLWRDGFKQARENLLAVIDADVESEKGRKDLLTLLYGEDYETTLKGSALEGLLSMDATQWKLYYQKLIEYSDAWDDAQKKMYEEQKKRADYRFENRADVQGLNQMEKGYESRSRDNARWGKPQSFAERMGLGKISTITEDPEVKMMEVRLTRASLYYKEMERLRQQNRVSQEILNDAEQKMMDAQIALQDKVAEHAKEKMQQIQALLDPIKDFGAAAGEAMYMTVNGIDGEGEAWRNAIKSIIKTYGEMTIQMIEKQLIQMLVMKQHHQEQEDEEQAHQDRMKQIQGQGNNQEVSAQNILNAKIISLKKKGNKAEEKEDKSSEENRVDIAGQGGQTMLDLMAATSTGMVNIKKEEAQETQQIEQQQQATSLSGLISDTVAKVVLGIAGGSAKTISELGWWGLPLVAVISAALMGLLNYALSAIGSGSKQSNNNAAKTNVKLKSGMLTYDEGNLGMFAGRRKLYDDGTTQVYDREGSRPAPFVGQDGHVYMATPRGGIPEGVSLVKQPIATTVNGQPSLVAEKGPEIVIGRKTTQRIMMNEPRLLHHLATIGNGRSYGGYRGLRTFDDGNLGDVLGGVETGRQGGQDNSLDAETKTALQQLPAAMAAFSQVMATIQQQGIPGYFKKYGAGSLDEGMREVQNFRKRYPVG